MNPMIDLKRLEFAVTYNCSSRCAHCFVEDDKRKKYPGHIGIEATQIVKEVASLYKLESVMTFGGESLLYPEITCAIHRTATDLGVPTRQIITNGLWTKDQHQMQVIVKKVIDAGVNYVLLSIDAFHSPFISIMTLGQVAETFLEKGLKKLKWNPCWVCSEDDQNHYNLTTKEFLKEVEYLGIPVGMGNIVSPNGAALHNLAEFMPAKIKYPTGKCEDQPYTSRLDNLKSICIEPNGDIAICPNFVIGNAFDASIKDILKNYDPHNNEIMRVILEKGTSGLLYLAEKQGIILDSEGYYSICDMCKKIMIKQIQKEVDSWKGRH